MKLKHKILYKNVLNEYEHLSTCDRLHVAALLVKEGRILSVGYNGVPQGIRHCTDFFKHTDNKFLINKQDFSKPISKVQAIINRWVEVDEPTYSKLHHEFAEMNEVHAEMNCIAYASKVDTNVEGCEMILSVAPCSNCAKLIVSAGIKKVTYMKHYDRSMGGVEYLRALGVDVASINERFPNEINQQLSFF